MPDRNPVQGPLSVTPARWVVTRQKLLRVRGANHAPQASSLMSLVQAPVQRAMLVSTLKLTRLALPGVPIAMQANILTKEIKAAPSVQPEPTLHLEQQSVRRVI